MRRFSIAWLMTVVFLIAADFAILMALWKSPGPLLPITLLILPMANLLLLAVRWAIGRRNFRHFWRGFEAGGWGMVVLVASFTWLFPDLVKWPLKRMIGHTGMPPGSLPDIAILFSTAVVSYTTLQLLVATAVGYLVAKHLVVIERRQPSSIDHDEDVHARPGDER